MNTKKAVTSFLPIPTFFRENKSLKDSAAGIKPVRYNIIKIIPISYFLKIPKGFPTGKNTFPKCLFNTAAAEP